MNRTLRKCGWGLWLLCGAYSAPSLTAGVPQAPADNMLQRLPAPLALAVLDSQRGGFFTADGLRVRIGFERVTLIDGEVVARSTLSLPDISSRMPDMQQSMATMSAEMQAAQETMQQSMDASMTALRKLADASTLPDRPELEASQPALSQVSDTLALAQRVVPAAQAQTANAGAGFELQHSSPATATGGGGSAIGSKVTAQQVQSPLAPAAAVPVNEAASVGSAPVALLNEPVTVSTPLTHISQTATSTLIQNAADNRLIQTLQVLNVELSDVGPRGVPQLQSRLQSLMVNYSR